MWIIFDLIKWRLWSGKSHKIDWTLPSLIPASVHIYLFISHFLWIKWVNRKSTLPDDEEKKIFKIRNSGHQDMQGTKNISCFCSKWLMKWISCDHIEHLTYESHRSGCHSCRRFPSSSISIADMSLMLRVRNEKLQDIPKLQPSLLIEIWRTMQTIEAFDFYFLRIFCSQWRNRVIIIRTFFTCYGNSRKSICDLMRVHIQRMHDMLLMEEMKNILMRRW